MYLHIVFNCIFMAIDKTENTVYVEGLPFKWTVEDIKAFFETRIESCEVHISNIASYISKCGNIESDE